MERCVQRHGVNHCYHGPDLRLKRSSNRYLQSVTTATKCCTSQPYKVRSTGSGREGIKETEEISKGSDGIRDHDE